MKKVKIFISQPMRGKTNEQIAEERIKAIEHVGKFFDTYDIEILDTFFADKFGNAPALYYLGESILQLSEADFAYFAPGWEDARGCVIERMCCEMYEIPILA